MFKKNTMQGTIKNNQDKAYYKDMIGYEDNNPYETVKDEDLEALMNGIGIVATFLYNVLTIALQGLELALWFLFKASGFILALFFDLVALLAQLVNTTHDKVIIHEAENKSTKVEITINHIHN